MAFVIFGLIGAVVIAVASIAGLLISAEAETRDAPDTQSQPRVT